MGRLPRSLQCLALILIALALVSVPRLTRAAGVILDPVLQQKLTSAAPTERLAAIVTFDSQPSSTVLSQLVGLGASIAPMKHLPMVGVFGTSAQITSITKLSGVRSVYGDRPLRYFLRESVPLIGATQVWNDYGYRGEGVGVAILDTGIDGTHSDLQFGSKTVENVKIVGLQYAAGQNLNALNLPAMYLEDVPNTDTTGGHGTHVAGIVGASGAASGGYYQGVAPNAELIGLSAGEGIAIFTALAGFDWVLDHKDEHNIRVVNCSWGPDLPNSFDPNDPINQATKIVHDGGVTVVFAAGNSGSNTNTMNSYSVAPWVISVAAGDKDGKNVSFFSSRGIPGDDLYHPTLTAPGYLIVSDRASTGTTTNASTTPTDAAFIPPEYLPYYTTASGTSMAAPHVAGAIALIVQANPTLTPDLIKRVLINTATPMPGYQEYAAGAGYLNVKAAVDQARQIKNVRSYRDPRTGKTEQVYDLTSTWSGTVAPSLPGLAASDSHTVEVEPGTLSLEVAVDWDLMANDLNLYLYDPQGNLAAKSETIQAVYNYANETVHVDAPAAGTWTATVSGMVNGPQEYRATSSAVVLVNP